MTMNSMTIPLSRLLPGPNDARQKDLAVLDEARAVGDAVVEAHCGGVRFMGQPVDPRAALTRSLRVDVFDQFAANARAADRRGHEKILKIAIVAGGPAGTVPDMMDEAHGARSMPTPRQQARQDRAAAPTSTPKPPTEYRLRKRTDNRAIREARPRGPVAAADRCGVRDRQSQALDLNAAEPVVHAVFPISAEILVHHMHADHILGVLEPELGRNPDLHRESVLAW